MPEAATNLKPSKTPRRPGPGAGDPLPIDSPYAGTPRQVQFQGCSGEKLYEVNSTKVHSARVDGAAHASVNGNARNFDPKTKIFASAEDDVAKQVPAIKDTQPASFPQIGAPPNSNLAPEQWHTSVDPTKSVSFLPGQPHPVFNGLSPQPQVFGQNPVNCAPPFSPFHPPATYVGPYPQQPHQQLVFLPNMAADYQNAGPPPTGLNFQPPVPDTTFGPIPHVYIPRYDGGAFQSVQVGPPSFSFVPTPPTYTTVTIPKTFYLNGYNYYAS